MQVDKTEKIVLPDLFTYLRWFEPEGTVKKHLSKFGTA